MREGAVSTVRGPLGTLAAGAPGGTSAVVLVPGFTGSKEDFLSVLPLIAHAGHHVVAVDLRGQGLSAGCDEQEAYAVASLADDVLTVVRGLAGQGRRRRRVHLLGHSFGGLVARAAVLAAPGAVASLTLLCSGPGALPRPRADVVQLLVEALPRLDLPAIWAAKQELEQAAGVVVADPQVAAWQQRRFLDNCPAGLLRMAEQLLGAADQVEELARVAGDGQLPLHVVYGQHDEAWPPQAQAEMARRLGAGETVLPGLAHSPAAENPLATAAVLTEFWSRVDRAPAPWADGIGRSDGIDGSGAEPTGQPLPSGAGGRSVST